MNQPTIESLAARLDKLERANHRLKRVASLTLVGIAAVVMMGQSQCNLTKIGIG